MRKTSLWIPYMRSVPEIIDPVFAKTSPKRSFSMTEYERFGFVLTKMRVYKFGHCKRKRAKYLSAVSPVESFKDLCSSRRSYRLLFRLSFALTGRLSPVYSHAQLSEHFQYQGRLSEQLLETQAAIKKL